MEEEKYPKPKTLVQVLRESQEFLNKTLEHHKAMNFNFACFCSSTNRAIDMQIGELEEKK